MPKVFFRGPMLVMRKGKEIDSILIPDGRSDLEYRDENPTRRHFAGMFRVPAFAPLATRVINDLDLTISDGSPGLAKAGTLTGVVPCDKVVNGPPRPWLRAAPKSNPDISSVITLFGGILESDSTCITRNEYDFPKTFNPAAPGRMFISLITVWSTPKDVTVTRTHRRSGKTDSFGMTGHDELYVFNFDVPVVTVADYRKTVDVCVFRPAGAVDDDYKWIYHMMDTPAGGWRGWLGTDDLPAPLLVCGGLSGTGENALVEKDFLDKFPSPDDGDCIGGLWDI